MNRQEEKIYNVLIYGWNYITLPGIVPFMLGTPKTVDYQVAAKLSVAFPRHLFIVERETTRQVQKDGTLEQRLCISWNMYGTPPSVQEVNDVVFSTFKGQLLTSKITYRE